MTVALSTLPDSYGFHYAHHHTDERSIRFDVLPPAPRCLGYMTMSIAIPDPTLYRVFADGEEIARVASPAEVQPALAQFIAALPKHHTDV